jgi:hypothetical protein
MHAEWIAGDRRYLSEESMALLSASMETDEHAAIESGQKGTRTTSKPTTPCGSVRPLDVAPASRTDLVEVVVERKLPEPKPAGGVLAAGGRDGAHRLGVNHRCGVSDVAFVLVRDKSADREPGTEMCPGHSRFDGVGRRLHVDTSLFERSPPAASRVVAGRTKQLSIG